MHYCKQLLRRVPNSIAEATCGSDMTKKTVLEGACNALNPSTIEKCFVKCGFVDTVVDTMEGEEGDCLTSHMGCVSF